VLPPNPPLDLQRLRADTPGAAHGIHLNNAGAALPPTPVLDAIRDHMELEVQVGGYEAEDAAREAIQDAYRAVEELLNAEPGTVAFQESATTAFTQALSAIPFRSGDLLLTTRHDYASNQIQYLALQDRLGIRLDRAPDDPQGGVDIQGMVERIHRLRPRLVAMTHIPTNSGLVQDPAPVAAACRDRGIPFLLDACQSVGQMPLDVQELGVTFLSATARKFLRGPRGSGFLYVSPGALEDGALPLFPDLRGVDWIDADLTQPAPDARRFETWEFAWGLVRGTGAAARYALEVGVETVQDRAWALAADLRERLSALDGVQVLDRGPRLSAIVTVTVEGWVPRDLRDRLRSRGIRTSWVDRTSAVLDFDEKGVEAALRISPHAYNLESEVEALVEAVEEAVREAPGGVRGGGGAAGSEAGPGGPAHGVEGSGDPPRMQSKTPGRT
jgi:selenocysteine lyase/cysteine desulfurase